MGPEISSQLVQAVADRFVAYTAYLRTLTSIDCPTNHKPGLDEVAGLVAAGLKDAGCVTEILENDIAGNDVIGTVRGLGRKRVLLLCHTDTVYPVGTVARRPFRVEKGHALAPGVCDMKGGLLSAIYSLLGLRDVGYNDFAAITVLCNSDEESAPRHSVDLIQEKAREADCVLTMEPARMNGDVVSARKGVLVYKITFHGREAHAGVNPDLGRNAIVALADRLPGVWRLNGYLPGLNVNPGLIQGGSAVNTVAGEATCEIDVRVARTADIEPFEAELRRRLEGSIIPDVTFEAVNAHTMPPMEKTAASAQLVEHARQAAAEIGFSLDDTATGGGSDGAYAAATGTPVLDGLGPIGGYAHSEHEYLDLDSVVPRTAMLARLITLV
jgi:glutamate carboxypeptidase